MQFEWDPRKAAINLRTHGVSFPRSCHGVEDDLSLTGADPDHFGERSVGADLWRFQRWALTRSFAC